MAVQMLLHTVDEISMLSGKENKIHETNIVSVDGKESRGSKRKAGAVTKCGHFRH